MCGTGGFYACVHSDMCLYTFQKNNNTEHSVASIQAIRFTLLLQQMRHKPEAPIAHTSFTIYFSMLINATQMFLGNTLLNHWGEMEKSDVPDFHSTSDNLAS